MLNNQENEQMINYQASLQEIIKRAEWLSLITEEQSLYRNGNSARAMKMAEDALSFAEKAFGLHDVAVATTLSIVGCMYSFAGKYGDAKQIFNRLLKICKNAPDSVVIDDNFDLTSTQVMHEGAEQLYGSLKIFEEAYEQQRYRAVTELIERYPCLRKKWPLPLM